MFRWLPSWKEAARTASFTMAAIMGLLTIVTFPAQVREAYSTCGTVITMMIFIEYIGVTFMAMGLICHAALHPRTGDRSKCRVSAITLEILVCLAPVAVFFLARGVGGLMGLGIKPHDPVWHPVVELFQIVLSGILLIYLTLTLIRFFRPKRGH